MAKSILDDKIVNLFIDNEFIQTFECYSKGGQASCLFMAYDSQNRILIILNSDFDYHPPETSTDCVIFDIDTWTAKVFYTEWLTGNRGLPYSRYTFDRLDRKI